MATSVVAALTAVVLSIGTAVAPASGQDTPVDAAPVATPDVASMLAPALLQVDVVGNDVDPEGGPLSLVAATVAPPEGGSVSVENGLVHVRSAAGFQGQLQVTYVVADATGNQAPGMLTVDVVGPAPNQPPVAVDDSAKVKAGSTYRIKVLANDSDPDGQAIRLVKVGKAKHGTAKRSGSTVRYRAKASFSGTETLTYTIRDSAGATATATLRIEVTARKPAKPKPPAAKPKPPAKAPGTSRIQVERAMSRLGLPVGRVDGSYDSATRRALCAWRTITARRAHRGLPSADEARALVTSDGLPGARSMFVVGVNVSRTCQAAFWVGSERQFRRVMPATTGMAGYRTRTGTYRIYRTVRTWYWSRLYPEARMYKPMFFSGGQALHGSATDALVRTYPASHGCVRMLHRDIDALVAAGVGNGTAVKVFGAW